MIGIIKRIIRIIVILFAVAFCSFLIYTFISLYWKGILTTIVICVVLGIIAWAFDW